MTEKNNTKWTWKAFGVYMLGVIGLGLFIQATVVVGEPFWVHMIMVAPMIIFLMIISIKLFGKP